MKIYNITPIKIDITNNKNKQYKTNVINNTQTEKYGKLPTTNQYLASVSSTHLDVYKRQKYCLQ